MWLRHFKHKRKRPRFRKFQERYYAFLAADVVALCSWHHEEISHLNYLVIARRMRQAGMKPAREWSWRQADELIQELRTHCDQWLKRVTPGSPPQHLRIAQ